VALQKVMRDVPPAGLLNYLWEGVEEKVNHELSETVFS